jgi:hypothetical protein
MTYRVPGTTHKTAVITTLISLARQTFSKINIYGTGTYLQGMMPLLMSTRLSRIEAVHTGHCHLGGKKSLYCQLYCKSQHLDKKQSTNESCASDIKQIPVLRILIRSNPIRLKKF